MEGIEPRITGANPNPKASGRARAASAAREALARAEAEELAAAELAAAVKAARQSKTKEPKAKSSSVKNAKSKSDTKAKSSESKSTQGKATSQGKGEKNSNAKRITSSKLATLGGYITPNTSDLAELFPAELLHSAETAQIDGAQSEASAEFSIDKAPDSGIEILVKMAEKGEIDPKNVDIVDVCDKFLKAIAATPKESLRLSGKVIFHAAVLLRMKAEALLSFANSQINPVVDDFLDFDADGGPILYDSNKQEVGRQLTFKDLEGAIVRRAQRKVVTRERKVTLDQLIAALKEAERLEKGRQEKKPKAARIDLSDHHQVNEYDDILDLAHDEDIEETIVKVEQWICENLGAGQNIELFELVIKLAKKDWVEAFLAALFLSNAGKIDLEQESFYGPLYLTLCNSLSSITSETIAAS
jgi:segregation and condensation protein A